MQLLLTDNPEFFSEKLTFGQVSEVGSRFLILIKNIN